MSAPRIDTMRSLLTNLRQQLDALEPDLEDIHDLAYNRHRAGQNERTKGGQPDYSLDTHGDTKARELYTAVAARLLGWGRETEKALKAMRSHLNQQSTALRRDDSASVSAAEHSSALLARTRRLQRGERHPHVVVAQPTRKQHLDPNLELEHLQQAVRRLATAFDGSALEHTGCVAADTGRRKPKPRWADRSILSPAQRSALDRALIDQQQAAAS